MKFPHCANLFSSTGSSTATTTTTVEVCEDIWSTKKCQRRKNKGKCNKNWVAKHCQLTCEYCDSGSTSTTTSLQQQQHQQLQPQLQEQYVPIRMDFMPIHPIPNARPSFNALEVLRNSLREELSRRHYL